MATRIERLKVALEIIQDTQICSERAERERDESVRHLKHCIRIECNKPEEPKPLCDWCAHYYAGQSTYEYELNGEATQFIFCDDACRDSFEKDCMTETQISTRQEIT